MVTLGWLAERRSTLANLAAGYDSSLDCRYSRSNSRLGYYSVSGLRLTFSKDYQLSKLKCEQKRKFKMDLVKAPKLQKPPRLNRGDTIGIIAPSLPVLPSHKKDYEAGKQILLEMGFNLHEGKTVGIQRWWAAGTPQQQAKDINEMFANSEVKAIITHTGGPAAFAVLGYLDYNLIKENPKPFLGYSDITLYHLAFFTKCGLVGFHSDSLTHDLGDQWPNLPPDQQAYIKDLYFRMLTQTELVGRIEPLTEWEVWREGKAIGHCWAMSQAGFLLCE